MPHRQGLGPGKGSSGLSWDDLAGAAHPSSPLPRQLAEAPAECPVQQSDKRPDMWPDRHTWISDSKQASCAVNSDSWVLLWGQSAPCYC